MRVTETLKMNMTQKMIMILKRNISVDDKEEEKE